MSEVRILNCSLQDDDVTDRIVLRGVLDQETLRYIRLDWYQREQGFSPSHISKIVSAFKSGNNIADITIGMRGQRVKNVKDTYILLDRCYCIDGGQRLYAAAVALKDVPDLKINLGVKAYTDTTEKFENELFCKLGTTQVKIASSVLIRNKKKESVAANMLINISKDQDFALKDRICWDQARIKGQLLSGNRFTSIVALLHARRGGTTGGGCLEVLASVDRVLEKITEDVGKVNVIKFFDAIDRCWTLRNLEGGSDEPRPHLKAIFLITFARMVSSHDEFWTGEEKNDFQFPEKFVRRLKGMPLAQYVTIKQPSKDYLLACLCKRLGLKFEQASPVSEAAE